MDVICQYCESLLFQVDEDHVGAQFTLAVCGNCTGRTFIDMTQRPYVLE